MINNYNNLSLPAKEAINFIFSKEAYKLTSAEVRAEIVRRWGQEIDDELRIAYEKTNAESQG